MSTDLWTYDLTFLVCVKTFHTHTRDMQVWVLFSIASAKLPLLHFSLCSRSGTSVKKKGVGDNIGELQRREPSMAAPPYPDVWNRSHDWHGSDDNHFGVKRFTEMQIVPYMFIKNYFALKSHWLKTSKMTVLAYLHQCKHKMVRKCSSKRNFIFITNNRSDFADGIQ